jgi:Protein of unknown function (DUF1566)
VLALLPDEGLLRGDWIKAASDAGISRANVKGAISVLLAAGVVSSEPRYYDATGCSGFVAPVLSAYKGVSVDWRFYQRSGGPPSLDGGPTLVAGFGLNPTPVTLTPSQIVSPQQIKDLISQKKLSGCQWYLFDARSDIPGKCIGGVCSHNPSTACTSNADCRVPTGHVGFVKAKPDGTLRSVMFSGITKGKDESDDTTYDTGKFPSLKAAREAGKLSPRSKRRGLTIGSFSEWYSIRGNLYKNSNVNLFELDPPSPSTGIADPSGRYIDRCETVFDTTTGLEWEKKTDDGGVHDKGNFYSWSTDNSNSSFDGTAKTLFLDRLNTPPCFAGHCDWRLPTIIELSGRDTYGYATGGIVDRTVPGCGVSPYPPCINPIFGPTRSSNYWSSSTYQVNPGYAWSVNFSYGGVDYTYKTSGRFVRAVRSGS